MELSELATGVVLATTLDAKLYAWPGGASDERPVSARRIAAPGRPPELAIVPARSARVPPVAGMHDPQQRARILHALANHELQAVELFAWAVLAFPDAPGPFRRGLIAILADEQRHCRLYIERLEALGGWFGQFPVTGHFWNQIDAIRTPLEFVCAMGLTFENANLDFAQDYAVAARAAGDHATAAVLDQVHTDEIRHVRFAWQWLRKLAPDQPAWEVYLASIARPLGPERARGKRFDRASRLAAGIDEAFVAELEAIEARRPNGARR